MNKQTHKCYSNYSIMRFYFRCFTTITRLINHSIDPSRYQSIDRLQSINHSIDRSKERSLNRSITRSVLIDHSYFRSVYHSIDQFDHRSISISIDREINHDRAINRSSNQSIKAYYVLLFLRVQIRMFRPCRYFYFFKIWARILRTLRIQHVQLRSYTHTMRIVTAITDRYV